MLHDGVAELQIASDTALGYSHLKLSTGPVTVATPTAGKYEYHSLQRGSSLPVCTPDLSWGYMTTAARGEPSPSRIRRRSAPKHV